MKYAIDVLIYVYENPGEMQKAIVQRGGGETAKRDRLIDLVDAELLRSVSDGRNWTAIRYYCTEEGARIAKGFLILESGEELIDQPNYNASSQQMDTIN